MTLTKNYFSLCFEKQNIPVIRQIGWIMLILLISTCSVSAQDSLNSNSSYTPQSPNCDSPGYNCTAMVVTTSNYCQDNVYGGFRAVGSNSAGCPTRTPPTCTTPAGTTVTGFVPCHLVERANTYGNTIKGIATAINALSGRSPGTSATTVPSPTPAPALVSSGSSAVGSADSKTQHSNEPQPLPGDLMSSLDSHSNTGRGGGGFGGNSSSSLDGSSSTLANPNGDGSGQDPFMLAAEAGGTYSSGGSGAASGLRGTGVPNGTNGGNFQQEMAFGRNPSAEASGISSAGLNVDPLGSEDPLDYFSRLGPENDLFKVVHNRYLIKAPSMSEGKSPP